MAEKKKQRGAASKKVSPATGGKAGFTPPEDGIGGRVALIRSQKELTHDGLSKLTKLADPSGVGISRTTIRGYELGSFKPGARELRILSRALQVSPTWLLLGTDSYSAVLVGEEESDKPTGRDTAQLMMAFMLLPEAERVALKTLAMSVLQAKMGEVEFRKVMGFSGEMGDALFDALKDTYDQKAFDAMKKEMDKH